MKPLAIDLFCGLGGWTEGLLAEGYYVVGFDIERHRYPAREFSLPDESSKGMGGKNKHGTTLINRAREEVHGFHTAPLTGEWMEYPAQLVLQSVLTLHGSQFKDAALIVASPPCQEFSYMAMPWSKAKAKERDLLEGRDDPKRLTALFDACFRIQREAIEAAGHFIPLVVENVRGAQKWVGRSRWNYGSFHLWGDVPALMPMTNGAKMSGLSLNPGPDKWRPTDSHKLDGSGKSFQTASVDHATGVKQHKSGRAWFADPDTMSGKISSKSPARKAASAAIAKIPFPLAQYIARTYKPA